MTLTESKNSVTYSIKNKCIHKTHDTEYSLLILVSDIIDEHVDCFDLVTVHFKDNVENVLLIKRFNLLQVVEKIYFKANISFISVFYFRECKWLYLWKLFKMQECAKYFKSTNFHHSVVDVELKLNFNAMIVNSVLLFLIYLLSKLINDYHHWEINKFVESWWKIAIDILMLIWFHICKKRVKKHWLINITS